MGNRYRIIFRLLGAGILLYSLPLSAQFLSRLNCTKSDALFTTYASPQARTAYSIDQGYQFLWNDAENGPGFISRDGLNFGMAFSFGMSIKFRLNEMYREPVVTSSYSDLVSYSYYPQQDIRVEVLFDVYSSSTAIADIRIRNEGAYSAEVNVIPYLYYPSGDALNNFMHRGPFDLFTFPNERSRDGWMKEHDIPLTEQLTGFIECDTRFDSTISFVMGKKNPDIPGKNDLFRSLKDQLQMNKRTTGTLKGLIFCRQFRMEAGEQVHFRMVLGQENRTIRVPELSRKITPLLTLDLAELVKSDEKAYENIPLLNTLVLNFKTSASARDLSTFYWSCFSLLRQCMMPPEGKCSTNYYVFSREPKWGWGYGGQVFHESLAMLAYAFMDPQGAMNSQRVYFKRQHPDGYINYRTGPYLDETIECNGKLTSSAPLFSYENLEVYRITHDKQFLQEAYRSGAKFYRYYVTSRDSNANGLCEWGGEASLESLRDARVAVWDKVGWPSNFEGPDLNSMLVMEAKSLEEMAGVLGFQKEAVNWKADAESRSGLVNKYLWDNSSGFYYNVNRKDQSFAYRQPGDLKIKEITGFLPLWAGISDTAATRRLVLTMTDPDEFWRTYGVPSLSATDDYYNPIGYWNGPVWIQWDYLLFRGLLDHGYRKEAEELAMKVMNNMIWHLKQDHVFWEFYSPDDREAGWNRTYIWAGLAVRFLLDLEK